jgi:hypothetical protein
MATDQNSVDQNSVAAEKRAPPSHLMRPWTQTVLIRGIVVCGMLCLVGVFLACILFHSIGPPSSDLEEDKHIDLLGSKTWALHVHPKYAIQPTDPLISPTLLVTYFQPHQGVVWVRTGSSGSYDLKCFVHNVLDTIQEDFALVTSDGDLTVPNDIPDHIVQRLCSYPYL